MATAKPTPKNLKPTSAKDLPLGSKAAVKAIAKTNAKAAPKAAAPKSVAPRPVKATKLPKPKKDKLVRDSFTIPKSEYLVIDALKQRAAKLGSPAKKSELIRAGFKALAAMADGAFTSALGNVPTIKTGRPSKA